MHEARAWQLFVAGLLLGLALPTTVSVASDGLELFEPRGLGTALFVAVLAGGLLVLGPWRLVAFGTMLGAAAYYPMALAWAATHGASLGG